MELGPDVSAHPFLSPPGPSHSKTAIIMDCQEEIICICGPRGALLVAGVLCSLFVWDGFVYVVTIHITPAY